MSKKSLFILSLISSLFFISSCHYMSKKSCCGGKKSWSKKGKSCCGKTSVAGQALVTAVQGKKIKGEVFFEQEDKYEVKVTANFDGLKANQKFGFHVHEFGNCENNALLAGAHLNPWDQKHGGPQDQERHLGDLGNLESNTKGQAFYSAVVKSRLSKFLGRSVVIHAMTDDLKSQPTGNSGDRIACGVIVAAMPPQTETPPDETAEKTLSPKVNNIKLIPAVEQKDKTQAQPAIQKVTTPPIVDKQPAVQKATAPSTANKPTVQKVTNPPIANKPAIQKVTAPSLVNKQPIQKASKKVQPITQKTEVPSKEKNK